MGRPLVSAFLALSLDGFIAGPDGDLAWLDAYATDSIQETGYAGLMHRIDTLVMGRNTHEKLLSFDPWPYPERRVVVLTHRPFAARHGESAEAGPLGEVLHRLWQQGARHVYLDGGDVVRQGLADGLVDELTLSWVPVILGAGISLFGGLRHPSSWQAGDVRRLPSGLIQAVYRPYPPGAGHHAPGTAT
ncbi:dihydrofolate reductase family protein [Azovibrio restrictus]|uniref:dihydrofolate reductase family protein n=1 Tax=Azovibrio restrictus TaxID=146938 RepID=UPI0026E98D75|nr:dihydrofolate reductase family protein [Azovibrio restrictus]